VKPEILSVEYPVLSRTEKRHATSIITIFFDPVDIVQQVLLLQVKQLTRLIGRFYGVEVEIPARRSGG